MDEFNEGLGEKTYDKLLRRIITNSFRDDIHFIPADGQSPSWSVIKEHSVIMFRYPLTAPIEIFDISQTCLSQDWEPEIKSILDHAPIAKSFIKHQPIKTVVIEEPFTHDILNRFVTLYAKLGSPDFTEITIGKILSDLRM